MKFDWTEDFGVAEFFLRGPFLSSKFYGRFSAKQSRRLVNTTWLSDTAFSYVELSDLTHFVLECIH